MVKNEGLCPALQASSLPTHFDVYTASCPWEVIASQFISSCHQFIRVALLPPAQPGVPREGMFTSAQLSPREPQAEPDRARHGPVGVSFHPSLFGSAKRSLYLVNGPKRGLHTRTQREKTAAFSQSPNSSDRPSPSPPKLRARASGQLLPSASFSGCPGCLISTTLVALHATFSKAPFHATSSPPGRETYPLC